MSRFHAEQRGQRAAHHRLVLGQQYPDHATPLACGKSLACRSRVVMLCADADRNDTLRQRYVRWSQSKPGQSAMTGPEGEGCNQPQHGTGALTSNRVPRPRGGESILQRAAERSHPLAHAAQAVAVLGDAAAAIVADQQTDAGVFALHFDLRRARFGVPRDIGDRLAQDQRQATLHVWRQFDRWMIVLADAPGRFQHQARRGQLGGQVGGANTADRAAHLGQRVARHLLGLLHFAASPRPDRVRAVCATSSSFRVIRDRVWPSRSCRSRPMRSRSAVAAKLPNLFVRKTQLRHPFLRLRARH